ncbi:hypothetical protein BTHI11S_01870 [Bosea thiooxidans]
MQEIAAQIWPTLQLTLLLALARGLRSLSAA